MYVLFIILAALFLITALVGIINPSAVKMSSRRAAGLGYGFWALVFFVLFCVTIPSGQSATSATQSVASTPPTSPTATSTLPKLTGDIEFRILPADYNNVVVNNDQGDQGDIRITNKDSFTWNDCTVGLDPTILAVVQSAGSTDHNDDVGDLAPGESSDVMATMLGMKEDDFRMLSSLSVICTNGEAQIDNIAGNFDKIAPLKTHITD